MAKTMEAEIESFDRVTFERRAAEWRFIITDMICRSGSGHLGGSLSLVEIMMTLYYRVMRVDPANPGWPDRDRLVLSKGHGGPVLYMALADKGYFPKSLLGTLNENGTALPSHADMVRTPGIDMTGGALGQGFSAACGIALAGKRGKKNYRTFAIIGDGESNEGQVWEAALFAAHNKLDRLITICDYNKLQIDGFNKDILDLEPLVDKWRAFNWAVFEADGHDWDSIYEAILAADKVEGQPSIIIAHTIKAKGNSVVENLPESHNIKVPDEAAYEKFLDGLADRNFALPY